MGAMISDSSTLAILVQLNTRFEPGDALEEMVALQNEFQIFSPAHSLHHAFALLSIVPAAWAQRRRWYKFLDDILPSYSSDRDGVNGHDRVVQAFQEDLESEYPLPVRLVCHRMRDDPRVRVQQDRPIIYSNQDYVVVSIPTTPRRGARGRRAAADAAVGSDVRSAPP
jgi:hypothetical protein